MTGLSRDRCAALLADTLALREALASAQGAEGRGLLAEHIEAAGYPLDALAAVLRRAVRDLDREHG